jgi:clan AA aspartic protease
MITGTVNRRLEVVITLPVRRADGRFQEVRTVLDTGFTGSLTLPQSLVEELELTWRSRSSAVLANGVAEDFDIYTATVLWDGSAKQILVQSIENVPLLGMSLLAEHRLLADVTVGGAVSIEPITGSRHV